MRRQKNKWNETKVPVRLQMVFMLFFGMLFGLSTQAKSLPQPFNNYRLTFGAGLGYSPLILMAPAPFNYKPWQNIKPSLKLELTLHPKYSFNFGYQHEHYQYDIFPTIELYTSNQYAEAVTAKSKATAGIHSFTLDFRKYSYFSGYIAPYGRYIFYGISFNNTKFKNEAMQFVIPDPNNDKLSFYFPEQKYWISTPGIRMGMGKKKYLGKTLKSYFEYQMHFDIKLGDFSHGLKPDTLPTYGGVKRATYDTAMRLSQMTSIFQFNLTYGFSM